MQQTTRKFCALSFFTKKICKNDFCGNGFLFFQHTKKKRQKSKKKESKRKLKNRRKKEKNGKKIQNHKRLL